MRKVIVGIEVTLARITIAREGDGHAPIPTLEVIIGMVDIANPEISRADMKHMRNGKHKKPNRNCGWQ